MAMTQLENDDAETPVIQAVQTGDRFAFGELVRRHNGWVRGVVYGVLGDRDGVEDVTQQVWSTAWQQIGKLRDVRRWRPWLYRLARNAAIDAGRASTRRNSRLQALPADVAGDGASGKPDAGVSGAELHGQVLTAIQSLPALYREPFVMRHLNGWSYREIADVMGMPVDSVETRLVRARRFLRESLKDRVSQSHV